MKSNSVVCAFLTGIATFGLGSNAIAQNTSYYAGQAAGGQPVVVELDSIYSVGEYSANFVYALRDERIPSRATCAGRGSWTTLDDSATYYPQSVATQNMINVVCGRLAQINNRSTAAAEIALSSDPHSNVRENPNGNILCTVSGQSYVNIYGHTGDWYYTDACGQTGVIHSSQIR